MKVKILKNEKQTEYPCLKVRKETGIVILFTAKNTGVVLKKGIDRSEVGENDPNWNETLFEKFEGAIELSND